MKLDRVIIQISDYCAAAIFRLLDFTKYSKALKDGPFPLPERERVHLITPDKFTNSFKQ